MPIYGLFEGNDKRPKHEFEGDYISYAAGIYRTCDRGADELIAAVPLREGQYIKQIEDHPMRGLEPQSKIMIRRLLMGLHRESGENYYPKVLREYAKVFRRSEDTLKRYEALAEAAVLKFAKTRR